MISWNDTDDWNLQNTGIFLIKFWPERHLKVKFALEQATKAHGGE
jgi:hypothetical protein